MEDKVEKICKYCGEKFLTYKSLKKFNRGKYCSTKCKYLGDRNEVTLVCVVCGKSYEKAKVASENSKYCSPQCSGKGRIKTEKRICKGCGEIFIVCPSSKNIFCSHNCYSNFIKGENSYLWKGGITSERVKARTNPEYNEWRKKVFARDNYTCVYCGNRNPLHAHHIFSFADFPELRYEIYNGETVCISCHEKIHGRSFAHAK
jgi:uncharacterized C2H2 Zn-finger protein